MDSPPAPTHVAPTHAVSPPQFWQCFLPAGVPQTVHLDTYDALMRDGTRLRLPLRDYGRFAIAGLIANQASFVVIDTLVRWLARDVAGVHAEVVVGLPTLGHAIASGVARALGHENWAAVGSTRKLWYDEKLSVPTRSVTAPDAGRRLWLDPRLLDRLAGRRVLLIDDVVSSGSSALAGVALLQRAGIVPVGLGVAMIQGDEWRERWDARLPVYAAFSTPRFTRVEKGWQATPLPPITAASS